MSIQIEIKVKRTGDVSLPEYATVGSSGFDLAASEKVTIHPGMTQLIPTGISLEMPMGFEMQIRPRSGLSLKTKLRVANSPGTIDSDFKGEIKIVAENTGNTIIVIEKGDRVAQGVLAPYFKAGWKEVEDLGTSQRGDNGFGSSDKTS